MSTSVEDTQPKKEFMGKSVRWWQRAGGSVLIISILIHVGFAIIAGYFVVHHFMDKPKPTPPLESLAQRSESVKVKMDVRQKTMSAPAVKKKVTTTSPLAKVTLPEMPDVPTENVMPSVMPGVSASFGTGTGPGGNGDGNGGGIANTTLFGTPGARVGLIGTLYDFKQTNSRQKTKDMTMDKYADTIKKFVSGKFSPGVLGQFYKIRNAIASTMIFIPDIQAEEGPKAFNVANRVEPKMWIVHYHATVVPPVSGRYHFVGAGDDVMLVGFDGRLVLDRCWNMKIKDAGKNFEYGYTGIPNGFAEGDAIDVVAGQQYPLDIVIGEEPGGKLFSFLFIEKEGEPTVTGERGLPTFPIFRVAKVGLPQMASGMELPPFDPAMPPWSIWKTVEAKNGMGIDTSSFFHQTTP